jgi:signal peptidase II
MLKYIVIAFFIIILDFISKQWIFNHLDFGSALVITPFFNIVHFQNMGAAFSFLSEASGWQRYFFIVVSLIAIVIIIRLMRKRLNHPLLCLALAFYWPAFNVADSFISIGVALILYDAFKNKKPLLS